jgi:hypothetical protein
MCFFRYIKVHDLALPTLGSPKLWFEHGQSDRKSVGVTFLLSRFLGVLVKMPSLPNSVYLHICRNLSYQEVYVKAGELHLHCYALNLSHDTAKSRDINAGAINIELTNMYPNKEIVPIKDDQ